MTPERRPHRPNDPVVVGVGQHLDRSGTAPEPALLMAEAVRLAAADAGVDASASEVVAAVPTFSWRYADPARIVAEHIGAAGAHTWTAVVGGNTPQLLMNRLAAEIAAGRLDQAVLCGGEADATKRAARRSGGDVPWPRQDQSITPDWSDGGEFILAHPAEHERKIFWPTQAYPLFETALWHASGRSLGEHLGRIGELWAGLSRVAAANPYAWSQQARTAADITTPTLDNRMVGYPYTKLMVANPHVDMSSAAIVCSARRAEQLGVPRDRWVFVHAGTDGVDRRLSERADLVSSPAMRIAGGRALELARVDIDDVAHLDLYACFPSAVQLAMGAFGIPGDRQLSVTGGLTFGGGPWSNPVGHAIATMVDVLRADPSSRGLVTGNGGHVDKHAFGVYSTDPPAGGFRHERPQGRIDLTPARRVASDHLGPARIEAWTVMHGRDGAAERAHAACLTPDGARVWGVTDDTSIMARFETDDVVGDAVSIGEAGALELE